MASQASLVATETTMKTRKTKMKTTGAKEVRIKTPIAMRMSWTAEVTLFP